MNSFAYITCAISKVVDTVVWHQSSIERDFKFDSPIIRVCICANQLPKYLKKEKKKTCAAGADIHTHIPS